jgi:hypothetical protein
MSIAKGNVNREIKDIVVAHPSGHGTTTITPELGYVMSAESIHHGTYDSDWAVIRDRKTGVETARFNATYIHVINWKE